MQCFNFFDETLSSNLSISALEKSLQTFCYIDAGNITIIIKINFYFFINYYIIIVINYDYDYYYGNYNYDYYYI